jgi:adenosylcobyric acid synthase
MLGRAIHNPHGFETAAKLSVAGLQLLDVETTFQHEKQTYQVSATVLNDSIAAHSAGLILRGYEIHVGQTDTRSPWLKLMRTGSANERQVFDGARSDSDDVWGCYLHGIFHNDAFRDAWLRSLGAAVNDESTAGDAIEASLEKLADAFESHIDMKRLDHMIWPQEQPYVISR